MATGVSLQLRFHDLVVSRKQGYQINHFQGSEMKNLRYLHVPSVSLSSSRSLIALFDVQQQESWNLHVANKIYRPLNDVPSRCNLHTCRCCLKPSFSDGTSVLKNSTLALSRSYNVLKESPLVMQLAPAFGIIAFSVWGLGPLMRQIRKLFLKNDRDWKKSKTHYIFTSYFQPLLLWVGASLVCRALNPVVLPSAASQTVKQRLLNFVQSFSTVLAFAYCLTSFIQQTQKFFTEKNSSDDARNMGFQFAGKAVYTAVWVAAFSLFMELLGFSTQKWVTAGGLGTVLLTLAGREIFTNFLSSIMIHATRPFVQNEWIQAKIEGYDLSGTVEHVGWWSPTVIRGEDREAIHIPNHKFTVNVLRNLTQKTHWRIKTHLAISHLDVNKINNIVADMRKVLAKNPQIEQQRLHRRVFLENVNPENQALLILISCFVKTAHFEEYLCVKEAILLDLLRVISHHRARLATPIRTVQKFYTDADMDNNPFSKAVNRPLLLIEPPSKINGEDKSKLRKSNEEQAPKIAASSESKPTNASTEDIIQNSSEKQQYKKAKTSDQKSKNSKEMTNAPSKLQLEGNETNEKVANENESLNSPSASKPAFEENILLGVAINGAKKTLSMEEVSPSSHSSCSSKSNNNISSGHGSSASKSNNKIDRKGPEGPGQEKG